MGLNSNYGAVDRATRVLGLLLRARTEMAAAVSVRSGAEGVGELGGFILLGTGMGNRAAIPAYHPSPAAPQLR